MPRVNTELDKARQKKWREDNPDRVSSYAKQWKKENPEYMDAWKEDNR